MEKEEKKETTQLIKVDFRKVSIQFEFEGKPVPVDIRKNTGNSIRMGTADIGLDELAKTIYFSDGEVEIPESYVEAIVSIVNQSALIVPIKQAVTQLLTKNKED